MQNNDNPDDVAKWQAKWERSVDLVTTFAVAVAMAKKEEQLAGEASQ